jgi:DNA-binding transcriptional MerR regulator
MYSIGKFAKLLGVTTQTLRNWHKSGELIPCMITRGGSRYYSEEQLKILKKGS